MERTKTTRGEEASAAKTVLRKGQQQARSKGKEKVGMPTATTAGRRDSDLFLLSRQGTNSKRAFSGKKAEQPQPHHQGRKDGSVDTLRRVVKQSLDQGMLPTALFFGDKLVTLTNGSAEAVYLLATAYYRTEQYRRALHLLMEKEALVDKDNPSNSDPRCLLLAAQCLVGCKEWEQGLELLGDENVTFKRTPTSGPLFDRDHFTDVEARLCLLRGEILEALENRTKAAYWYQQALKLDIFCYEAFERLIENHMLTSAEEKELMDSLTTPEDADYLKALYLCKLKKYDKQQQLEETTESYALLNDFFGNRPNLSLLACRAETLFYRNNFNGAYQLTKRILEEDPYTRDPILCVHISSLVELNLKTELYYCAHKLVDDNPSISISWYAVGCYYFLCKNYEQSRTFFSKATSIDPYFGPAWLGFGHAFAAQGEHDQAMAAYRTATRLLAGCHIPSLCIGMELGRINNINLADQYITQAQNICRFDPLISNELGVLYFKRKEYERAAEVFTQALAMCDDNAAPTITETIYFNAGHSFRKLGHYEKAIDCYQNSLRYAPHSASTFAAIGFTYHLSSDLEAAIEHYHQALSIQPDDSFTTEMLSKALQDAFVSTT
ncbi:anaphase-promoting complex subunit Cut9 [Balamuthia mandrillaris]